MKTSIWAGAVLAAALISPAAAVPVQLVFTGTMTGLNDPSGWLHGAFAVGQSFSVNVSFDTDDATYLGTYQTSKLGVVATSGGQVLSAYSNPAASCASIYESTDCGMLSMEAFASSNPVGGDALRYIQHGPLQLGSTSFPGAVTGSLAVSLTDYGRTAFADGATLTAIPDINRFLADFSFTVISPIARAGTPEQSVTGYGRISSVTFIAATVPEPSTAMLGLAGLALLAATRRNRHSR